MGTLKRRKKIKFTDEEVDDDEAFCSEDELEYGDILASIEKNVIENKSQSTKAHDKKTNKRIESILRRGVGSDDEDYVEDGEDGDGGIDYDDGDEASDYDDQKLRESRGDTNDMVKLVRGLNSDISYPSNTSRAKLTIDEDFELHKTSNEKRIEISDLLSGIKDDVGFDKLKSKYYKLNKISKRDGQVVDPQLNEVARDRIERKVAYEESKKEVSKWTHIVKNIRESEHIRFPLNKPAPNDTGNCNTLAADHSPSNEVEKAIESALEEHNLHDKDLIKRETDNMGILTPEERATRVAELSKIRSIVFYKNQKLKRISKIKSRTYRKHHRKKFNDDIGKGLSNDKLDDEDYERRNYLRVQERMTLKHKKSSTWRKKLRFGDSETQATLRDQDNLHKRLVMDLEYRENETHESSESLSSDSETSITDAIEDTKRELLQLKDDNPPYCKSSLSNLKFMQRAIQNDVKDVKNEIENAVHEIDTLHNSTEITELNIPKSQDADKEQLYMGRTFIGKTVNNDNFQPQYATDNPWLSLSPTTIQLRNKRKIGSGKSHDSKASAKVSIDRDLIKMNDLSYISKGIPINLDSIKQLSTTVHFSNEETVHTPTDGLNAFSEVQGAASSEGQGSASSEGQDVASLHSDHDSLPPPDQRIHNELSNPKLMTRAEIVSMVFSKDNLENEFNKEKDDIVREEGPQYEDTSLPGWNSSWSGPGLVNKPPDPKSIKLISQGKTPSERKDMKLDGVIISEKKNKKFCEKYQTDAIPFGYCSKDYYERLMRMPLGKEWNALSIHKKAVRPRISVDKGSVIEPIKMGPSAAKFFANGAENRAKKCGVNKRVVDTIT